MLIINYLFGRNNAHVAQSSCRQQAAFPPKTKSKPVQFNVKSFAKAKAVVETQLKETGSTIEKQAKMAEQNIKLKAKTVKNILTGLSKNGHEKQERNLYLQFLQSSQGAIIESNPEDIALVINYCSRVAEQGSASEKDKADIRHLFSKLAAVPENKFDRRLLLANKEKLQRLLSPALDKLLVAEQTNSNLKNNQQHQLDICIAEAKLIFDLGIDPSQRAGGCNGAVLIKNLKGKAIGVFKAPPNRKWDVVGTIKGFFGQNRLFNRRDPMNEPYSEVAMHYFSEIFGFNLSPAATTVEFKNETGAFLAFLGGYQELADVKKELESRDSFSKDELVKWQLAIVAIFASLNFDPHDGNIFVKTAFNAKGEKIITDIKIIDGGNNFAEVLPGQWGSKGHRKEPGDLKISKEKFTPEIIEFIQKNMTDEKYEQFLAKVKQDRPGFMSNEMSVLLRKTIQVLRNAVVKGDIATPHELLNVLTDLDYSKHLKEKPLSVDADDWVMVDIGDDEAEKALSPQI